MTSDFDQLFEIIKETDLLYFISKDISKLITELAVGDVYKCKFCKQNVVVLKEDNNEHESYLYNGYKEEYVCSKCAYAVIKCDICKEWQIHNITFTQVQQCCGLIYGNDSFYYCNQCERPLNTTFKQICFKCAKRFKL